MLERKPSCVQIGTLLRSILKSSVFYLAMTLDRVVQRTNAYWLSLSMNKNIKATFKTIVMLQDCKPLKILSKEAVVHMFLYIGTTASCKASTVFI